MSRKTRLELTWIGKEQRPRLEPRILVEDEGQSYHARQRVSDKDLFDNRLVHGDNLLALKALESDFVGAVKCVYIDPPFNTGQAFENYDDGLEHSLWLTLIRDRLEVIHRLLHESGTLAIHIDDNELGYLIAVCDEIFQRANRISVVTFKQSAVSGPKARNPRPVSISSYVLIYAKDKNKWKWTRVFRKVGRDARYDRYITNFSEPFHKWNLGSLEDAFDAWLGTCKESLQKRAARDREELLHRFVIENAARVVRTARVAAKDVNDDAKEAMRQSTEKPNTVFCSVRVGLPDYYFLNGEQFLFYSSKVRTIDGVLTTSEPVSTIWDDLLSNNLHKEGGVNFPDGKKPEALIKRLLEAVTEDGDLVLDSFAGSGTTGAVAHKLRRRWIMVERGAQAYTHIVPRLKGVIDGTDLSGITKAAAWKGGGGFRYYRLAPSLMKQDPFGRWVINPEYRAEQLAEAVCKLMGFSYAPSSEHYWQHGRSTETDFIYVTTASFTQAQLTALSEEVGPDRTLLVCCKAFRANVEGFANLTLKKIPQAVLAKCEWGRDDYSLAVSQLPPAQVAAGTQSGLFGDESA